MAIVIVTAASASTALTIITFAVTVTAATVTPDLREATVFYTVYGDESEVAGTAVALTSATGVLRSAVGAQTGIKFTPTLVFKLDTVPENAYRIKITCSRCTRIWFPALSSLPMPTENVSCPLSPLSKSWHIN